MNVVREDNLPLQVFVHGDDIEYEKRNRLRGNPVVFINGIGVWHREFDGEFAGFKRYYDARNYLILTVKHESGMTKRYIRHKTCKMFLMRYLSRNYAELELSYMGAMDFLRGREWLKLLDQEEYHRKLMAFYKESVSYVPIKEINIDNKTEMMNKVDAIGSRISLDKLMNTRYIKPGAVSSMLMCIRNGMLGLHKRGAALTTPNERFWEMNRHYKQSILYVPDTGKAMLVKPEIKRLFRVIKMYISFSLGLREYDIEEWRK